MIKNLALTSLIAMFFCLELSYAGCGACNVTSKKADKPDGNFVTKIGEDGNIGGLVLASCGMCNFGMRNKDCSLAIQISDKAYNVKGTDIDDHGDSHAKDGFCNAIRVAKVSGKVKKNMFLADSFELQKH